SVHGGAPGCGRFTQSARRPPVKPAPVAPSGPAPMYRSEASGGSTEPSMSHTPAWRAFKRTEDCACAVACLIYLAATLHAWGVLHVDPSIKLMGIVAAPLLFLVLSLG